MTQSWKSWGWKFCLASSLAIGGAIAYSCDRAFAQSNIVPDDTLGAESSIVIPNSGGLPVEVIDGGVQRGANLFHSFQEFNVDSGRAAFFTNPVGIENILSRVTGANPSNIQGKLGVLGGNANLFLINPNGIIFGPNASLDIRGSFVASTASAVNFADGTHFSATNPEAPPLLAINVPLGLQFGMNQPGEIANAGNLAVEQNLTLSGGTVVSTGQLAAPAGQVKVTAVSGDLQVRELTAQSATLSANHNLTLVESQLRTRGDLTLSALDTVRVRDSRVNPFNAQAGGNLHIQGNLEVNIFALNHPASGFFSGRDMVLSSANTIGGDARYTTGGSFRIERLDGSLGNLFSPYDPIIRASGNVSFDCYVDCWVTLL